jgi:starvation-inducible DNA-binding protein
MNTQALNQVLIDSYALAVKTQNYHWNVTGSNFSSLHSLFESQYDDLFEAIDEIAERIRAKGEKVSASLELFSKDTTITTPLTNVSANEILKDLIAGQEAILASIKKALQVAQAEEDEATADMLIERVQAHDKNHWVLESSLA